MNKEELLDLFLTNSCPPEKEMPFCGQSGMPCDRCWKEYIKDKLKEEHQHNGRVINYDGRVISYTKKYLKDAGIKEE